MTVTGRYSAARRRDEDCSIWFSVMKMATTAAEEIVELSKTLEKLWTQVLFCPLSLSLSLCGDYGFCWKDQNEQLLLGWRRLPTHYLSPPPVEKGRREMHGLAVGDEEGLAKWVGGGSDSDTQQLMDGERERERVRLGEELTYSLGCVWFGCFSDVDKLAKA
ncbi:hypothetical protein GW17_00004856 [Ensete ventricosum]|nr:hypothetical protein GW17_00004856 [Ensete ventricosum]RZS10660.1 hypothetical protein BHM03_00041909 [Ensete ventricosum]